MTDDERARAVAVQILQPITQYPVAGGTTDRIVDLIAAYGRDERRRAFEDCAKIAETRQGIHGEYIATAIRRQAEEETT